MFSDRSLCRVSNRSLESAVMWPVYRRTTALRVHVWQSSCALRRFCSATATVDMNLVRACQGDVHYVGTPQKTHSAGTAPAGEQNRQPHRACCYAVDGRHQRPESARISCPSSCGRGPGSDQADPDRGRGGDAGGRAPQCTATPQGQSPPAFLRPARCRVRTLSLIHISEPTRPY